MTNKCMDSTEAQSAKPWRNKPVVTVSALRLPKVSLTFLYLFVTDVCLFLNQFLRKAPDLIFKEDRVDFASMSFQGKDELANPELSNPNYLSDGVSINDYNGIDAFDTQAERDHLSSLNYAGTNVGTARSLRTHNHTEL